MSALPNAALLSKLSPAKKAEFKEKVAEQVYVVFENYAQLVRNSTDPKDIEPFLRWGTRVAELEPKQNDRPAAPIINITFDLGDDKSNVVEMTPVIEEVEDAKVIEMAPAPPEETPEDELPDFSNEGLMFALDALEK